MDRIGTILKVSVARVLASLSRRGKYHNQQCGRVDIGGRSRSVEIFASTAAGREPNRERANHQVRDVVADRFPGMDGSGHGRVATFDLEPRPAALSAEYYGSFLDQTRFCVLLTRCLDHCGVEPRDNVPRLRCNSLFGNRTEVIFGPSIYHRCYICSTSLHYVNIPITMFPITNHDYIRYI